MRVFKAFVGGADNGPRTIAAQTENEPREYVLTLRTGGDCRFSTSEPNSSSDGVALSQDVSLTVRLDPRQNLFLASSDTLNTQTVEIVEQRIGVTDTMLEELRALRQEVMKTNANLARLIGSGKMRVLPKF